MTDHDRSTPSIGVFESDRHVRDHYTLAPLAWLAGCSDVGQRHEVNQDALALGGREDDDRRQVAVVSISDGVSTSRGSEHSAATAAEVVCSTMVAMLRSMPQAGQDQINATLVDAFAAANDAVLTQPSSSGAPGSCTLITVVLAGGGITVANVGDCRAYWIGDDQQAELLSVDDSVAQARIELGMSREEAEHGFQAHAITRWLGPDAQDVTPRQTTRTVTGAGWLLVCSDGLWNYCSPSEQMSTLVQQTAEAAAGDAAKACERLVEWANQQGGRDNITVALLRVQGVASADPVAV